MVYQSLHQATCSIIFLLLDPLFALLCIEIPRCAKAPLMTRNQASNHRVLARLGVMLAVSIDREWSRNQAWPVDLQQVSACLQYAKRTKERKAKGGERGVRAKRT